MASKEGFNEQLRTIQEKAKQLSVLKNDKTELFNQIDNLPRDIVEAMEERYKNTKEPINTIRKNAADFILRGNSMTDEFIESEKSEQKLIHGEAVFRLYKNPFSIFYPFILLHKNQPNERELLIAFSNEICNRLELSADQVKIKIVDFTGSNNLGADWVWFAIYNATHKNQRTAKQLFFALSAEGIFYSFYNRLENKHVDEVNITTNEFDFDRMLKTFAQHVHSLREDVFKDQIVVKIPNIYKISHGTEVITQKQFRQLLERNLIIVHGDTPPLGKLYNTQYDDFEAAEIGSLFYLCRSNQEIVLIGQLIGEIETCEIEPLGKDGWIQRKYEIVAKAKPNKGYHGKEGAWWLPSFRSTFYQVPERDFQKLDKEILLPFFDRNMVSLYDIELDTSTTSTLTTNSEKGAIVPFEFADNNADPILGVHNLTKPLAEIIRLMKDDTGQMIGVFGRWGRGKTYFITELLKQEFNIDYTKEQPIPNTNKLKKKDSTSSNQETNSYTTFYFTKFHAWKYQDTEGAWAYLYQILSTRYFSHLNKPEWDNDKYRRFEKWYYSFRKWLNEKWLLFKLNTKRNGIGDLIILFFCLPILIIICLNTNTLSKDGKIIPLNLYQWFLPISLSMASGLAFLNFFRKGYKLGDHGKRIVQKYTHKPHFNKLLGIQSEIQDELKYLIKAWIKEGETSKKEDNKTIPHSKKRRIILFVDDIDRCHPEKIIGIVDALRVVLEDNEIAKRMIIIMAVDEEKLEGAIIHKYADLLTISKQFNDPGEPLDSLKNKMKGVKDEYLDKLFITGISLPELKQDEVTETLKNYAKKFDYRTTLTDDNKNFTVDVVSEKDDQTPSNWEGILGQIDDEFDDQLNIENLKNVDGEKITIHQYELECLEGSTIHEPKTPRKLRIILYRFLLCQLIISQYRTIQLTKELKIYLAKTITSKTLKKVEQHVFPEEQLNDQLMIDKIINMVVPY